MDVFINANNCLGKYIKKKVPFNYVLGRFLTSNKHTDEKSMCRAKLGWNVRTQYVGGTRLCIQKEIVIAFSR